LNNIIEKWIYFIQNAGSLAYIPDTLSQSPEIAQAFTIANEAGLSATELELQWRRKDFIYLQRDSIILAREQGLEQGEARGMEKGFEKGMEKGREEATLAFARRLLASGGMSTEQVAEMAGISVQRLL